MQAVMVLVEPVMLRIYKTIRAKIYVNEPLDPFAPLKTDIKGLIKDLHTINYE